MAPSALVPLLALVSYSSSLPAPDTLTLPPEFLTTKSPKSFGGLFGGKRNKDPLVTSAREKYYYHPNYGFEPYWANGEWLIVDPIKELGPNATTPRIPLVCGEECSYIYRGIGEVCAQQSGKYWLYRCWYSDVCYGKTMGELSYQFVTFSSYCEFLDAQCRSTYYGRWDLLYRGACVKPQSKYFLPIVNATEVVQRMEGYLSKIEDVLGKVTPR